MNEDESSAPRVIQIYTDVLKWMFARKRKEEGDIIDISHSRTSPVKTPHFMHLNKSLMCFPAEDSLRKCSEVTLRQNNRITEA